MPFRHLGISSKQQQPKWLFRVGCQQLLHFLFSTFSKFHLESRLEFLLLNIIIISETGESSALAIPWSVLLVVFCSLQLQRKVSNQYIRSVQEWIGVLYSFAFNFYGKSMTLMLPLILFFFPLEFSTRVQFFNNLETFCNQFINMSQFSFCSCIKPHLTKSHPVSSGY